MQKTLDRLEELLAKAAEDARNPTLYVSECLYVPNNELIALIAVARAAEEVDFHHHDYGRGHAMCAKTKACNLRQALAALDAESGRE